MKKENKGIAKEFEMIATKDIVRRGGKNKLIAIYITAMVLTLIAGLFLLFKMFKRCC